MHVYQLLLFESVAFVYTVIMNVLAGSTDYQTVVRFTPAMYKFLLGQECSLEDLKAEDPALYK